MAEGNSIDGVLLQWGDRLFYPPNRLIRPQEQPRLRNLADRHRVEWLRERIAAAAVRRAPQVMVKVTGGGRGMNAIAAHLRYITKNGRLEIEDGEGRISRGKEALREVLEEWRYGGSLIPDLSERREAFNIMLSMPRGSAQASIVERAAREFARTELRGHKYVMVLHDHQANPHVHISVRAESKDGRRLNPRKADLQRWRETFAERLRELGIDAEATRQATRGVARNYPALWQEKAQAQNRLWAPRDAHRSGEHASRTRADAAAAWLHLAEALSRSADPRDRQMAPHCAASATRCQISARQAISVSINEPSRQWGGRQVDPPALTR